MSDNAIHTKTQWTAYGDEEEANLAVYACGKPDGSAIAHEENPPTVTADLTGFDYLYNEDQISPVPEFDKEAVELFGQDELEKQEIVKNRDITPGHKKMYVQTATWLKYGLPGFSRGFQGFGLSITAGADSGLAVSTAYSLNLTLDGVVQSEIIVTLSATPDPPTYTSIVADLNARMLVLGYKIDFQLVGTAGSQEIRATSHLMRSTSAVAMTPGTTGTSLTTMTGWSAFATAVAGTSRGGQLPRSFYEHFDNGANEYNAFGNYVETFVFIGNAGEVSQTIDYESYSSAKDTVPTYGGAIVPCINPKTEIPVEQFRDVSLIITDEFPTAVQSQLKEVTLTITNTYKAPDERQANDVGHKYPFFLKTEVEAEITQYNYHARLFESLQDDSPGELVTLALDIGPATFTITNMKLAKESLNINTMVEKGVVEYAYTLEIGGAAKIYVSET